MKTKALMPTIASQLDRAFRAAIAAAFGFDADPLIAVAQNEKFGDYQSNAAMGLAKELAERTGQKTNPRQVAEQIKAKLDLGEMASEVTIAGPGFINVRLSPQWLGRQIERIAGNERLGVEKTPEAETVVVDYSGPNIAKEMHVGHLRSTIIGDSVSRVLEFRGDRVVRQNHIGDWGTQFGKVILAIWTICHSRRRSDPRRPYEAAEQLADAVRNKDDIRRAELVREVARRHQENLKADWKGEHFAPFLEKYVPVLDELLPVYQLINLVEAAPEAKTIDIEGPYGTRPLAEQSKLVTSFLQKGPKENPLNQQEVDAWRKVRDTTMNECQRIYNQLGVRLKRSDERGESTYNDDLANVVRELKEKGLAVESAGAIAVFIDGPDKTPLIVEKSGDEGYLYATTDLAAIRYRVRKLGANRILYFVDARQSQHFAQVFATARAAGWAADVTLEHAPFGTMLGPDGKPFKTRSGDVAKLKDLLEEAEERAGAVVSEKNPDLPQDQRERIGHAVGIGAVKYADLSKDRTSDYVFSWEKMLSLDGNTAPYLQYAHARIRSIFRQAARRGIKFDPGAPIRLESPFELALAKHILRLTDTIDLVARELKPHHLTSYLYELSTRFSGFFENCPVIQSDEPTRSSRLRLVDVTARTLALGLDLLGIEHPDQM